MENQGKYQKPHTYFRSKYKANSNLSNIKDRTAHPLIWYQIVKIFWLTFHENMVSLVSQKSKLLCHVQYGFIMEIEIFILSFCVILQDIYGLI